MGLMLSITKQFKEKSAKKIIKLNFVIKILFLFAELEFLWREVSEAKWQRSICRAGAADPAHDPGDIAELLQNPPWSSSWLQLT